MTQLFSFEAQAKARISQRTAKNAEEMLKAASLDVTAAQEAEIAERLDSMPETSRRTYLTAMRGRSKSAGIKAFCMECVCWQRQEVAQCTAHACPLYPYRPFGRE